MFVSKKYMKNILIMLCVFILGGLLVLYFTESLESSKEKNVLNETINSYVNEDNTDYQEVVGDAFLNGCLEGAPGQEAYCQCAYDVLIEEIGVNGILEISLDAASGKELTNKQTEAIGSSAMQCLNKFVY